MRIGYATAALLVSALALAGCNKGAPANNTAAPAPAANTAEPAPAAAPAETDNSAAPTAEVNGAANQDFQILNKTGHTVVAFNVSPTNENEWGPDILGQDVLNDGESAKITFKRGEDECMWDLRATYDDNDTTEMKGVNLCQIATVTLNP